MTDTLFCLVLWWLPQWVPGTAWPSISWMWSLCLKMKHHWGFAWIRLHSWRVGFWLESLIAFPKSQTCRVSRKKEPLIGGLISSVKKSSSLEWYQCRKHTHVPLQPNNLRNNEVHKPKKPLTLNEKGREKRCRRDKKQNLGGRVARPPEAKSLTLLEA